jgi:hypothetical protein
MRALGLVALSLFMEACGYIRPSSAGRYQQISNPNPPLCLPEGPNIKPNPGCGITILDTQTGTIFIKEYGGWHEESSISGKTEDHVLK